MTISLPRNHFPLDESALHSVLVAGGIGITPILAMARRMDALGRSWELHYACRSRADAAFLDELAGFGEQVRLRCDDEHPGSFLDIAAIARTAAPGTHFYCCGPKPMLAGFEAAMADIPSERVHLEYFAPKDEAATGGGFTIELIRSGREIFVPAGKSILDVVQEAGIRVAHSCTEGVCGSCETGVLRGRPDHRDSVLSPGERARGDVMMICCSGSLDDRLALDL
jgi:ferredoxin-NADP reductase